jgi:pimeloyl-ACP methyl ester carboxylesterase
MITLPIQGNCDKENVIILCYTDLSLQHIHSRLAPGEPFSLLGYSFGGLLALELAMELEAEGREGHLYLVDSAPEFSKLLAQHMVGSDEKKFETSLVCRMFSVIAPHEATAAAVSKVYPVRNVKLYYYWYVLINFSSNLLCLILICILL